jgi:hypothetical protein
MLVFPSITCSPLDQKSVKKLIISFENPTPLWDERQTLMPAKKQTVQ